MDLDTALDTIKRSIPVKAETDYQLLLSDMVNYVEIKTRGFSYPQGISNEPVDWLAYGVTQGQLLEEFKKQTPTEQDIVIWLANRLKNQGLVRKTKNQNIDRKRKLKLLRLKKKAAQAQLELLKMKL